MNNVYCNFCNDYIELISAIHNLRQLLAQDPKVEATMKFRSLNKEDSSMHLIFSDPANSNRFIFEFISPFNRTVAR